MPETMLESNETDVDRGEIHIIVRPPKQFEVHSSYDQGALYYTLGQVMHMIMMGGLNPAKDEEE